MNSFQNQSQFKSSDNFGSETLEKNAENSDRAQQRVDQERAANNAVWTNMLTNTSEHISITKQDSEPAPSLLEQRTFSFEEIFQKVRSESPDTEVVVEQKEEKVQLEGSFSFGEQKSEIIESKSIDTTTIPERELPPIAPAEAVEMKQVALSSAEKTIEMGKNIVKGAAEACKTVFSAIKELWTGSRIKEKKEDPKEKEKAAKKAQQRARKAQFMQLLREGMSIYYAQMRKALYMLEAMLGVNVLRSEDKNQLMGRSRNMSFEGNDNVYAIHQTAFAMVEQKKRQQQAVSAPTGKRGPSRGQIFTDKTLSGERSAGNNMMSAVG